MSRSKHTDPVSIRAMRRLRDPFEKRDARDLSLRRKQGRTIKDMGLAVAPHSSSSFCHGKPACKIVEHAPSSGFHHPAAKAAVAGFLRNIEPVGLYGLRSIELVRLPDGGVPLMFGRYETPGRIILFEQPLPPWRLPGRLKREDARRLRRAGAVINLQPGSSATLVEWSRHALEDFMLNDVLLHEVGHHVLQHNKGKRTIRIARSKDHEAFALQYAQRAGLHTKNRQSQG